MHVTSQRNRVSVEHVQNVENLPVMATKKLRTVRTHVRTVGKKSAVDETRNTQINHVTRVGWGWRREADVLFAID
jgi:hypothetical protein